MNKIKEKTFFVCQNCGYHAPKWMGKCPDCGEWHSFLEEAHDLIHISARSRDTRRSRPSPLPINDVEMEDERRITIGIKEFDRVLGGGIVAGSLVLIGGDPGIGKSTLLLQVLHALALQKRRVLYISGEESIRQIKLRSKRLGIVSDSLLVVSEISLESIQEMVEDMLPEVVAVDSIQTIFYSELSSAPGSVSQVREATMRLMLLAKRTGVAIFLVGHVTKEGNIAGPRLLEHMVDTVLYFEGDRNHIYRILRAVKNRFGSTNEIGVFEMKESGLQEIDNPSALFLSERPFYVPGSVVTASIEGTRPLLLELQALVTASSLGVPRRTILGLDHNRVSLLVAVMEKKLGFQLFNHDIFMNVVGGVKVDEPAVDLGIVSAISSSFLDKPIRERTLVLGEIGLTGEIRGINLVETRLNEACKMGFERCIIPGSNLKHLKKISDMTMVGVNTVSETLEVLF